MNIEKKILLVEDSPTQAMKLKMILQGEGFDVVDTINGEEAMGQLEHHKFHLIISDIQMPVMNGYEFCHKVKSNKTYANIPFIFLTSLTDKNDLIKGLAAGANSFVSKPIEKEDLLVVMDELLGNTKLDPEIEQLMTVKKEFGLDLSTINFLLTAYQMAINKNNALDNSRNKLKEMNENLELLVKRRTSELEIAKKKAEESDIKKSIFLSNSSHDLRTPINAIIGFSELLKDETLKASEKKQYLNLVSQNGETLLNLLNDIIDIAKIEAGVLKCDNISVVNVCKLLSDLEQDFKQQYLVKNKVGVELLFDKSSKIEGIEIETDVLRLKQILSNLISNALKCTVRGWVKFSMKEYNDNYYCFYVSDTGIGIPETDQKLIFERFVMSKSINSTGVGHGLGLTICKNLVKLLGGEIWVESKKDEGSTFMFTIPREIKYPLKPNVEKETINDTSTINLEGKRILIVEDNQANFKFLKAIFTKTRASILWAKDGEEAIKHCRPGHKIDLIMLDINIPKIDGLDVVKIVKKAYPHLPVIAQTAFAMVGDRKKCLDAGCDDYIAKPLSKRKVLEIACNYFK